MIDCFGKHFKVGYFSNVVMNVVYYNGQASFQQNNMKSNDDLVDLYFWRGKKTDSPDEFTAVLSQPPSSVDDVLSPGHVG